MKKPCYNDLLILDHKTNGERKPSQQTTPEFSVHFSIYQRIPRKVAGSGIKHSKKFFSKPGRLRFIPHLAAGDFIFHFREKTQRIGHFLSSILALSSSRDKGAPGPFSYCLSLRSSSAL
jgi:hypothetical protein